MKGLITLLFIVFLGWCFGSTYWYVCKIKGLCEGSTDPAVENVYEVEEVSYGNLLFSKSSKEPETNSETQILIDSLKNIPLDTLVIIGQYFSDETGGEQLGMERATNVQRILKDNGFNGPTRLATASIEGSIGEGKHKAVSFQPIVNPASDDEGGFTFTATDSKIIINFPVASADPHGDSGLIDRLKEFATEAAGNGSKVVVSGHTDNSGTQEANKYYGQLRADVISNLLIEYGMDEKNINAISKGESEPMATNETKEGRKQNRRVEIEIISN